MEGQIGQKTWTIDFCKNFLRWLYLKSQKRCRAEKKSTGCEGVRQCGKFETNSTEEGSEIQQKESDGGVED